MGRHGRASVSSRNPRAFAICDRCGFLTNHDKLSWQFDYAGAGLINKNILVCGTCLDVPSVQRKAFVLAADPIPIQNPRPPNYVAASANNRQTSSPPTINPFTGLAYPTYTKSDNTVASGVGIRVVENLSVRSTQLTGAPPFSKNSQPGTDSNAIMPFFEKTAYGVVLPILSITTDGVSVLTITCSSPHNLITGNLISVLGGGSDRMNGFYNVTVINGVQFTYQPTIAVPIPGISDPTLLQPTTVFKTAYVGLPYGMNEIPQSGPVS